MHFTDFYAIIERDLDILNPTSAEKMSLLAGYCGLQDGHRVLDIGSGKGYLLRSWAQQYALDGTGLEINPSFVAQARERAERDGVADRVTFVEGPARDFTPQPASYDVVTCIGAPFAIGSFDEAVDWMIKALKPSGTLAIGDQFLSAPIPEDVLNRERVSPDTYRSLSDVVASLEDRGLTLTSLIASSFDDWDRYVSSAWRTAHAWAKANPNHPDRAEVLQRVDEGRDRYLRFERQYIGWGTFVARRALAKTDTPAN